MPFDYKKEYKEFYLPKDKPSIVTVPSMNYIAVRGKGDPNAEDGEYKKGRGSDMEHIKKNFGFGFMRLPIKDGEIDLTQTSEMVDAFLDAGFNYFDTAHGYLRGKSETALKACLTSRYPRSRYCTDGCPKHISIPDLFAIMNTKQRYHDWNADYYYSAVHTAPGRKASDCLECGKCEKVCPQHLPIRQLLKDAAKEFEKK